VERHLQELLQGSLHLICFDLGGRYSTNLSGFSWHHFVDCLFERHSVVIFVLYCFYVLDFILDVLSFNITLFISI